MKKDIDLLSLYWEQLTEEGRHLIETTDDRGARELGLYDMTPDEINEYARELNEEEVD